MTKLERVTAADSARVNEAEGDASLEVEHPFRGLEEGWVRIRRTAGRGGAAVRSHLVMELDSERTAWVFAEAERLGHGTSPERVVEGLIDGARDAPPTGRRENPPR